MKYGKLFLVLFLLSGCFNENHNNCWILLNTDIGKEPVNNRIEFSNKKYCKHCRGFSPDYTENCKKYNTFWEDI